MFHVRYSKNFICTYKLVNKLSRTRNIDRMMLILFVNAENIVKLTLGTHLRDREGKFNNRQVLKSTCKGDIKVKEN